jgi:hypothetical protein
MLSSNMLVPILIPLIDVTFSTPTRCYNSYHPCKPWRGTVFIRLKDINST